ncbi:MAG TPA: N-acetylmuramoyl-L-alanine amidase [Planctomycetota bacterium]
MRHAILGLTMLITSCGPGPSREPSRPSPPPPQAVFRPTAIVIHSTSGLDRIAASEAMKRTDGRIHVLIDADGTVQRLLSTDLKGRAARGMDDAALHVSVVGGIGTELLADPRLLESAARVVGELADRFEIPRSNADVISRRGVFSHMQAKFRFGGLRRNESRDAMEPGEAFVAAVLRRIGGEFREEKDWVGRGAEGWMCVWEGGDLGLRGELTKGRGLTTPPAPPRAPLEMMESRRMRYVDRGTMGEIRGIVLHFTATRTFEQAVEAFERRRLGPSIIVDTDGRAWQVVDRLEDRVAAAGGTNDHCVQIEIVGENEAALLDNAVQLRKVVEVVSALCAARSIVRTNRDIESLRGVFSHGQAKKRWGRSAWMWGGDFDPGERFMKRVIEEAGGTYAEEKDWAGRRSGTWVVEFEDWLP